MCSTPEQVSRAGSGRQERTTRVAGASSVARNVGAGSDAIGRNLHPASQAVACKRKIDAAAESTKPPGSL